MKAMGIILAGGNNEGRLGVLTENRAAAALPVGSCYRAIDFTLSNMSASAIGKVAVLTQYNSRSLRDHITSSKWWDFGRKQGGLFVFTPYTSASGGGWFRGTADSIFQNITYLQRSNEEYVVIASGDSIYKMDYRDMIEAHMEKGADITVAYKKVENSDLRNFGILEVDETQKICCFEEKPEEPKTNQVSMGVYIISRTLLMDILNRVVPEGKFDFVTDVIIGLRDELSLYGYAFDGYWNTMSTGISAYFHVNMDFLKKDIRDSFINEYPYVETKPKDEPPAKYNLGAEVLDTIAGSGTIFNGKVTHAVVFRKVFAAEDSYIRNAVIMEGCRIGKGCVVENAILDKGVILSDGVQVIGESMQSPVVVKKGTRL